jgi:serine/threonine-protein kinase
MDRERFRRVESLFEKALELPESERDAFLDGECGDDPELRREVESLLTADDHASGGFMDEPADRSGAAAALGSSATSEQDRVDRYRLLRKIGEGGMSELYLAVRDDDEYQKRVALKIIRSGLDREDLLRRFRTERQILAGLDHPNIATLLDGGTTEAGLPYFAMDFIEGLRIDEYCDRSRLSVRERLELFRTVCSAVQYAHQNLVVHRDIKSSNILVTSDGTPKLLDFGIAKLLKPDQFAEQVEYTATWMRPMTPRYASPEQIEGKPVTTTTDVYSLGVLLYKLLTGHLPYELEGRPPTELARLVLEHEPERPSATAVRDLTDADGESTLTAAQIAQARRAQPEQLRRQLEGDLDNIVLMALRKEPQRRYASVEQFSEDVRRYLVGLPVTARKVTLGYRTAKFLRRNRLAVAAAGAFVVLLVGFSVAMGMLAARVSEERDQARLERDRAEQVVEFMEGIFEVSDPYTEAQEQDITAREILDRGAERVSRDMGNQPEVQATLLAAIGNVFRNLSYYDRSEALLRQALETRRSILEPDDPAVAQSLTDLGMVLSLKGDYEDAEQLLETALELRRQRLDAGDPEIADGLYTLARLRHQQGEFDEAQRLYREAIGILEASSADDLEIALLKTELAFSLGEGGDLEESEATIREVVEIRRRRLGNDHVLTAESLNDLGTVLGMQGKYDEAEPLLREALAGRRRGLGEEHPGVAETMNNLAQLFRRTGRLDEAEPLFRRSAEINRLVHGDDHALVSIALGNLARVYQEQGEFAKAEPLAREALSIRRRTVGDDHHGTGLYLKVLGSVLVSDGRSAEAEPLLRESVANFEASLPPDHWWTGDAKSTLGECLVAQDRFAEAEPFLLDGLARIEAGLGPDHDRTRQAVERLVALYEAWQKPEDAARYRARLDD